jgi:RNA recognition motif-containing protein
LKAKNNLHLTQLEGRSIRIGWAQKNTNLLVFNLPEGMTVNELVKIFSKYGSVQEDKTVIKYGVYVCIQSLNLLAKFIILGSYLLSTKIFGRKGKK